MADKPTNKERLKELGEKIEAGIREVFDSGKYAEYLKVMSRFPTYSVNNQMLIRLQRPNATKVAGYNKWQQFERHVKRGRTWHYDYRPHTLQEENRGTEARPGHQGPGAGCQRQSSDGGKGN